MQVKGDNIESKIFLDGQPLLTLHGNPLIIKKRDMPNASRPKMYMRVRELLAEVASDFGSEVIELR